jgi:hypothetical protein
MENKMCVTSLYKVCSKQFPTNIYMVMLKIHSTYAQNDEAAQTVTTIVTCSYI